MKIKPIEQANDKEYDLKNYSKVEDKNFNILLLEKLLEKELA